MRSRVGGSWSRPTTSVPPACAPASRVAARLPSRIRRHRRGRLPSDERADRAASVFPFSFLGGPIVSRRGDVVKRHARPSLILPSREPSQPSEARAGRGPGDLGYLVSMPSVQLVQALARTGVDWLMIDIEHAPIGIESVAAMIAATGGTPATPLVRVPGARRRPRQAGARLRRAGRRVSPGRHARGRRGHGAGACATRRRGGAATARPTRRCAGGCRTSTT